MFRKKTKYRVGDIVKVSFDNVDDKILEIRMANSDTEQYLAYDFNGDSYVIIPKMVKELLNN